LNLGHPEILAHTVRVRKYGIYGHTVCIYAYLERHIRFWPTLIICAKIGIFLPCSTTLQDVTDLATEAKSIKSLGVSHGDMLYMLYRWVGGCRRVCVCQCGECMGNVVYMLYRWLRGCRRVGVCVHVPRWGGARAWVPV